MSRRLFRGAVLAAAIVVMTALAPSTAHAAGTGVITGSGTLSPGLRLPCLPVIPDPCATNQNVSFSGTATGLFGTTMGSCTVNFTGVSLSPENVVTGVGVGSATCNGPGISVSASLSYNRTGVVVVIAGSATINGSGCFLEGAFYFVAAQTPPAHITSYTLVGAAACIP